MQWKNLKGGRVTSANDDYIRILKNGKLFEIAVSDTPQYVPKSER